MARKHIHKLKRKNIAIKPKKYIVYACILPGCNYYAAPNLLEGKIVLCNRCDEPMVMTKLAMTLAMPHCLDCTKSNKQVTLGVIEEFLEDIEME